MTTEPAESQSPSPSRDDWVTCIARTYFSPVELEEVRNVLQRSGSYEDALAYLVDLCQDLRLAPHYTTIPGGRVLIAEPDRPEGSLAYIPVSQIEVARRAFPCPQAHEGQTTEKKSGVRSPSGTLQFAFWEESELAVESREVQATNSTPVPTIQTKAVRSKKLVYIEQSIAVLRGAPKPGWVVKDRGLGYFVEPMRTNAGYVVSLVHLKSRREMVSVVSASLDHERIRAWVAACVPLTDWTQGIGPILKEQQGEKQKQRAWTRRLETIWYEQKITGKRQLAFF